MAEQRIEAARAERAAKIKRNNVNTLMVLIHLKTAQ
jgi:hypothetical protein